MHSDQNRLDRSNTRVITVQVTIAVAKIHVISIKIKEESKHRSDGLGAWGSAKKKTDWWIAAPQQWKERPASAIDWGVVGSVAVFDDGIRFWGYYVCAEGMFQGKFTVYKQYSTEFSKLVNLLCATLWKKISGLCHLTNFLLIYFK